LDIPGRHAQQAPHDKTRHMTEVMLRDSAVNNKETASTRTKKSENTPLNKQLKHTRKTVAIVNLNPNI